MYGEKTEKGQKGQKRRNLFPGLTSASSSTVDVTLGIYSATQHKYMGRISL